MLSRLAPRSMRAARLAPQFASVRSKYTGPGSDIKASAVVVEETKNPKTMPPAKDLKFGHTFTDHMLTIPWNAESGWGTPEIKPYQPLCLDPSATVFHYAFTLFEGTKAYLAPDGGVRLFRPDKNMERMNNSAARIALPNFDGEQLTELIKKFVTIEKKWIPKEKGYSLYLRPTLIGTEAALGVGPSHDALLFVIASPVGPYYPKGFKPVQLYATTEFVRAAPGGTGAYKLGANYAPGVVPQKAAAQHGYSQNLWLLGDEHALTEVGTMNLFVAFKKPDGTTEVVTPPLGDIVLPGVTRDSALALMRDHASGKSKVPGWPEKLEVNERKLVMADLVEAEKNGTLVEVFGTGTAAVVSAVDKIGYAGRDIEIPCGPEGQGMGDIAKGLLDRMDAIQTGRVEHEWSVRAD